MNAPRVAPVPCPLCGSARSSAFVEARDRLHGVPGRYRYVTCGDCGLVYMNPQVVPEDLPDLYPRDEYAPYRAADGRKARGGLAERVRTAPYAGQLLREILSPVVVDDRVARRVGPESRWLDLGCGNGSYLARVRAETGCHVYGVDFSETAVTAARTLGIEVFRGTVRDAPWPDASFSVVSGWWYLEHVPDPVPVAARIASLLEPRGSCVIAVPNRAGLNARIFGASWYHLDCPRHLTLWTPQTIARLLEQEGLEVERMRYDKSAWGLLGSLDHVLAGRRGARGKLESSRVLSLAVTPWTLATAALHASDTIVVYGRKR